MNQPVDMYPTQFKRHARAVETRFTKAERRKNDAPQSDQAPERLTVDFAHSRSKTDRPRVIPLNSQARKVVAHQLNDATVSRFVFPSSKTDGQIKEVKKGLAGACKQAGIRYGLAVPDGITFHSLRHWFSSKLEDLGVSKTVRRDLLGHEPRDMTDDYTHSTIEMRRRAVSLLCQTSTDNVVAMASKSGRSLARV